MPGLGGWNGLTSVDEPPKESSPRSAPTCRAFFRKRAHALVEERQAASVPGPPSVHPARACWLLPSHAASAPGPGQGPGERGSTPERYHT